MDQNYTTSQNGSKREENEKRPSNKATAQYIYLGFSSLVAVTSIIRRAAETTMPKIMHIFTIIHRHNNNHES
jgi:hypothetical protein